MRTRGWVAGTALLLALTGCGDAEGDEGSSEPEVVVTEAATEAAPTEAPVADPNVVLEPGVGTTLVNEEGDTVEVTLERVTYPEPKTSDVGLTDEVSPDRVFVVVEMRVENVGTTDVYGTNVYPSFETADGQQIDDVGWVVAAYNKYGSGEFSEELPETVSAGKFAQGWSLYEVPPQPGFLVFPYGPSPFKVAVNPPAG